MEALEFKKHKSMKQSEIKDRNNDNALGILREKLLFTSKLKLGIIIL